MTGDWGLRLDSRLPGDEVWRFCREYDLMQVHDNFRKCIGFLEARRKGGRGYCGTVFLVYVVHGDKPFVFAVTAAHCLDPHPDDPDQDPYDSVHLVLNTTSGSPPTRPIEIRDDRGEWKTDDPTSFYRWKRHPTSDVAVALLLQAPSQADFDYRQFELKADVTPEFREEHWVTPGDPVMMSGLFVTHPGDSRIVPIVRMGNIAAFPSDPIDREEDTVLIEVRSIGGLSGSPAFLDFLAPRFGKDGHFLLTSSIGDPAMGGNMHLLGVVQGYFQAPAKDQTDFASESDLNSGITVVVPAKRIVELTHDSPFKEFFEVAEKQKKDKRKPKPAGAPVPATYTEDEFLRDLRKVTQPVEPPDREA